MAAYTSAEYLASIRRAVESAMVQLQEAGFDLPQFTDKSIFYSIQDAVDDVNAEWETTYEATAADTSITFASDPTRQRSRAICLHTAALLLSGWANLNLTDGSMGASYREGLASIDTRGQATHAKTIVERADREAQRAIDRVKISLATSQGSSLPTIPADSEE